MKVNPALNIKQFETLTSFSSDWIIFTGQLMSASKVLYPNKNQN